MKDECIDDKDKLPVANIRLSVMVFPFDIAQQINESFMTQVQYQPWTGTWIVWDGDTSKAEQLKQTYPTAYVMLYDQKTGTYTRYFVELLVPKMNMVDGKFVTEFEKWKV